VRIFGVRLVARALSLAFAAGLSMPTVIQASQPPQEVSAYLDGRPIPVASIPRYYCDDFSYPEIHCSSQKGVTETRTAAAAASGADYATIYDQSSFAGTYMHLSQDYPSLLTIGWNDRISSFKGRNLETARFWTDWFHGGTSWSFCCNTQTPLLGSYNNTFSSVHRT
jgi:hypothetical protein